MIFRTDDCLGKIFRIQANPDPVSCGHYNHTTSVTITHSVGYGDFFHDSFPLKVIKFGLDSFA